MNIRPETIQKLKMRYDIVGRNEALNEALRTALQVADTDLSVLIQGESGVGKETLPRIIHDHSARSRKRYIAINCGSIPEGTIDSELFGHEKGSFTSAISDHEGYFGAADGGTLFLDEVGELPMSTQARLLRVLETGEYMRVGSNEVRHTNARIVAATNVDIPHAIRNGRFREDLYYRLCSINILLPPLRDRQGDAVLLFKKFALDIAGKYNIPEPIRLTPEAEMVVNTYKWPGNIRQLRNITEQLSILSPDREITPQILAKHGIVPNAANETAVVTTHAERSSTAHDYENQIKWLAHAVLELRGEVNELKERLQGNEPMGSTLPVPAMTPRPITAEAEAHHELHTHSRHTVTPLAPLSTRSVAEEIPTAEEIVEEDSLNINEMEQRNIVRALERNHYSRKQAAEELGISERTLYRKIKKYGIDE
ncbi:MAG: sigma-54-dependent Fis family transcriptional regulator [Bacteroidaceae bacterium]|nr:sigma-54-dependent Fis family transcriptional regulator [Bacteroidaceae bacterium]